MATFSITFPSGVSSLLDAFVPGFASASGGGDTVQVQFPVGGLPAPVVAGLDEAGFRFPPAGDSDALVVAPAGGPIGLSHFAPLGLVPQGDALENPDLAGANAVVQNLIEFGEGATAFFHQAAANPPPADYSQIGAWIAEQQQAVHDYILGG